MNYLYPTRVSMNRCPRCGGPLLPDLEDGLKCLWCAWAPYLEEDKMELVQARNLHPGHFGAGYHLYLPVKEVEMRKD